MKTSLSFFAQFVLFLLVFVVGSFVRPFRLSWDIAVATSSSVHRIFVPDGLILMIALFVVILIIEALTKRLRALAPWTTAAFLLAGLLGYALKLGFITRDM